MIPPIVREVERLGSQLPTYVKDFESWANNNDQFRELNDKYDITSLLSSEASQLPSKLGDAAGAAKEITVGILNNIVEAVVVLTLAFFLLLDGRSHFGAITSRLRAPQRERVRAGRHPDRRDRPLLRLASTCCSRRSRASSPGSRWSCSGSTSPSRSPSSSASSTSCR